MTGVALWLLLIGVLDLVRGGRDASRPRLVLVLAGVGAVGALLLAVALRPSGSGWPAWVLAAVAVAGWLLGSGVAAARFQRTSLPGAPTPAPAPAGLRGLTGTTAAALAYGSLGVGLAALLLAGSDAGSAPALAAVLAGSGLVGIPTERVLLVGALLLVQVSTVNVVVRLLLDLVGVPASDNEKTLRGGRVLGPMERLIVLGLGLAGSLTGAAIVVAAKALLRFPELRVPRAGDPGYGGASDVTEYFLVGSFASWTVALGCVALAALTG